MKRFALLTIFVASGFIIAPAAVQAGDFITDNLGYTKRALDKRWSKSELRLPVNVPSKYVPLIEEASSKYNVDPKLIAAVIFRESAFNAQAVSRIGAQGLMQLMPRTAASLGVKDSFDPRQNIMAGTKYLRMMLDQFDGKLDYSLAAYNAGPVAVQKKGLRATQEAVEYVAAIRSFYRLNS